jgi:hypothetical protein
MDQEQFRDLQMRLRDPLLTALTVMMFILLFVIGPLQAGGLAAAHYFGIIFALVLIAAVYVVSGSRLALAGTAVALVLSIVTSILRAHRPSVLDIYLDAFGWLVAGITLSIVVARAVFTPGQITFHRIIGAVLLYLDVGLIFAALYCLAAISIANAFSGLPSLRDDLSASGNFIYFSFVTLTSVGYGDIAPVHPFARALANVEAIIGQLYPATLLARLVTLELANRERK